MYKKLLFISSVLFLLFSAFFTPAVVSADCSPYEVYSVDSVFKVEDWLLVKVSHLGYTCEMIAGEWMPVLVGVPDESYILTDGNRTVLLGATDPSGETFVGFMNETLYVLTVNRTHVPYKNVTIAIEGVSHNFTLLKDVTMKTLYRFNGTCLENVSTCGMVSYPNGTKINTCNESVWNVSNYKIPGGSLTGVPVKIENNTVHFTFERHYYLVLPEGINASALKLEAFKAKHGFVLINMRAIKVPAGEGVEDVSILFVVENKTVYLPRFMGLEELICAKSSANTVNSAVEDKDKKGICGPGLVLLLSTAAIVLKRLWSGGE